MSRTLAMSSALVFACLWILWAGGAGAASGSAETLPTAGESTAEQPTTPATPPEGQPLFYLPVLYPEGSTERDEVQLLTANGTVLLFSTELRVHRYLQVASVSFGGYAVQPLFAEECVELLQTLATQGLTDLALDRCPTCLVVTTVPIPELSTTEKLLVLWSVAKDTYAKLADADYARALEFLTGGEFGKAAATLAYTANALDPADARVHFLRGYCGLLLDDPSLTEDALGMLSVVDPSAQGRLQALVEGTTKRPTLPEALEYIETLDRGE